MTFQGVSPRRYGAPVVIMLYYPRSGFPGDRGIVSALPAVGAGMAQGGLQIFEKGFLQSQSIPFSGIHGEGSDLILMAGVDRHCRAGKKIYRFLRDE